MHLKKRWVDRRVYEYFAVNVAPFLGWRNPILVYQMGKVGSSSIRNSLFRCPHPTTRLVLMSHEFLPVRNRDPERLDVDPGDLDDVLREIAHDERVFRRFSLRQRLGWRLRERLYAERIYRAYVQPGRPLRVITLVREPVAHNISMFFQLRSHYIEDPATRAAWDIDEHIAIFLERYIHSRPLTWFDSEFRPMLGVDVYCQPFSYDRGYARISRGPVDVLVLRCELDDDAKARAIGDFLGLEHFEIVRSNVTEQKSYGRQYAEFKRRISVPGALLEKLYESKYARHFYSTEKRAELRARWGNAAAEIRDPTGGEKVGLEGGDVVRLE
jgi:hypothetical protein